MRCAIGKGQIAECASSGTICVPWNKGKLVGQKLPLKLEQIWAIRIRLEIAKNIRELAMFNLAIDCRLRSCDMVKLLVRDISRNREVLDRAQVHRRFKTVRGNGVPPPRTSEETSRGPQHSDEITFSSYPLHFRMKLDHSRKLKINSCCKMCLLLAKASETDN